MPIIPYPVVPTTTEGFGPCAAWDPIWCVELPTASAEISGYAVQMATEILWARSGMRYDQCTFAIRPCSQNCWNNSGWPYGEQWWQLGTLYPQPALIQGNWYNLTCGSCSGSCSCTALYEIMLPVVYIKGILNVASHPNTRQPASSKGLCGDARTKTTRINTSRRMRYTLLSRALHSRATS